MLTVCHLTSVHPPFDIRIFHKQCLSLAKEYMVNLIAPVSEEVCKEGVLLIPIKLPESRLKRMWVVSQRMKRLALKTNADLFHFHDPELLLCGVLLKLKGKKVIFDIHENVGLSFKSKTWIPKGLIPFVSFFYYLFERFAISFFDALVLAEESYLKYYPERKSTVILNYPILQNDKALIKNNTKSDILQLVYVGGVSENRGIWEMLKISKELYKRGIKHELTIVGKVYSDVLRTEITKFINKNKLQQHIEIVGQVPFEKVKEYLIKSDVGLALLKPIPNYKESLPTKIFEYMQYGLPVITNDFSLYKKYIEEENSGICIDVALIDQEMENIINILTDKGRLKQMGENGLGIINKYNWKSEELKLNKLYKKLLE